jgi:hypothetical protein
MCGQCFRIELSPGAASEAAAICRFSSYERAAQIVVPAAKQGRYHAEFFTENDRVDRPLTSSFAS